MRDKDAMSCPVMLRMRPYLYLIGSLVLCCLVSACSGGGGYPGDDSGIAGEQKFIGKFVDRGGNPASGITVKLVSNGNQAQTDASGTVELLTDTLFSGNVDLQVIAPWGAVPLTLFGVTTSSRAAVYNVTLDDSAHTAAITSFQLTPLSGLSVAASQACLTCHASLGDPNCASASWVKTHASVYTCNLGLGGSSSSNSCRSCHGDRGSPQCGDSSWKAVHSSYSCNSQSGVQNPGSWQCTSCHKNEGHPRCGDAAWEEKHGFVSCDRGTIISDQLKCDSCHTLKTTPKCNDPRWQGDHPFWSCGNNSGECTSCHTYKGEPRCNDDYWKQVHNTVFSCSKSSSNAESLSCGSCHTAKVETKCDDAGWKATHNFFASGKQTGSTRNLCASCHENDRGATQCDDATWKSFHCLCG